MTTTLTASTTAQLNQDIATADAATSGSFIIDLQANITETAPLDAIDLQSGVPLTIDGDDGSGGGYMLDGAGSNGFLVDTGSVTIENLDISNAVLSGGSFPATVTLSNDVFSRTVTIQKDLTVDEIAQVRFGDTTGPATVTNQAGSTYDIGVIGSAIAAGPVGVSRFINKGTLAQTSLVDAGALGVSNIYANVTDTGTLSVADGSNLRFFGANNTFSGTYVGGGMIDYWTGSTDALGTIDMTNGACTTVYGATVNQSGVVTLSANSTISNYGTWNFTSNKGLVLADPSQPSFSGASFTLHGTLAKTGGTGTTVIECDFNPDGGDGPIRVASGTLAFNGLINNFYDAISGAGIFRIGGGGADEIDTGTTIKTGGWTIAQASTDVTLNAALSYSGTFKVQSGATLTLTPSNTLTLKNSASFANATVNGSGVLALVGGGTLTMNGGTIGAGVTVELVNDTLSAIGTVTNSGTLFASGGTVLIAGVGASVQLAGGTISGGNLQTSSGGRIDVNGGGNLLSGSTIMSGSLVEITDGGTLTLDGTIANSGLISANGSSNPTDLDIMGTVLLSGGGKVSLSPNENNSILAASSGATLTNVDNTIVGAGTIGAGDNSLTLVNSGTTKANTSVALTINTGSNTIANFGSLVATASGGLVIDSDVANSRTIEALGTGATVLLDGVTVTNGGSGVILASGTGAQVKLDGATISGGKVQTSGANAVIETIGASTNTINEATIARSSLVEATSGTTLTLNGGTIGSAAIVEALSGGTVSVTGTVTNFGTLLASGAGSTVAIAGVVNAGIAKVGNGTVDIQGAGNENVTFMSGGTGGLQLDDASAYTGKVTGFGSNTAQFIDFTDIDSSGATISYTPNSSNPTSGGVLTVSSGGHAVASINMVGKYVPSNFTPGVDSGGHLLITDPPVAAQQPAGTLWFADNVHIANIALLGNYMAASFVTAADGHGGTPIIETPQSASQPLSLTTPHTG